MPQFTIGRLARAAGVPTSTVRYYERSRLLHPEGRTDGNYRVYGTTALENLRFIRAAQAIGLTLENTATLLDFRDGRTAPFREVQTLIEERLSEMRKRLRVERLPQIEKVEERARAQSGPQTEPQVVQGGQREDDAVVRRAVRHAGLQRALI